MTLSLGSLFLLALLPLACHREKPTNPPTKLTGGQIFKADAHRAVEVGGSNESPSNRLPPKVTLLSPEHDSTVHAGSIEQDLIFTWRSSQDPDGDVVSYVWFLIDAEKNRILHWKDTGQDTFSIMDGCTIAGLFPTINVRYDLQWEVRVTDGKSAISSDRSGLFLISDIDAEYTLPSHFPGDFPSPEDQLTGSVLGGWGGSEGCLIHTPIVFLHGNGHTAGTWNLVAQRFLGSGYFPKELWALSYIDFLGGDSANSNMGNVEDIDQFVNSVLDYTGSERVDVIAHSLGVTVARAWMREKDAYEKVEHFVAIAGANHGVTFCFGPLAATAMCQEIGHPDTDFLSSLNDPDETPQDDLIAYMTIYDGTGADIFYPANAIFNDGSTGNLLESPRLDGATNVQLPGKDHLQLKDSEESFDLIFNFLNSKGYYVQH